MRLPSFNLRSRKAKKESKLTRSNSSIRGTVVGLSQITKAPQGVSNTKKRRLKLLKPQRPKIKLSGLKKKKAIILLFSLIFLIISLAVAYSFLFASEIFHINEINIDADIENPEVFDEYFGKNIFLTSNSSVEQFARDNVPNISDVYVRKLLPNKLLVEIELNQPVAVTADKDSIRLVDKNIDVIEVISDKKLEISEFDQDLINNAVDLDDPRLIDLYFDTLTSAQKEETTWSEIELKTKQKFLENLKNKASSIESDFFENQYKLARNNNLENVPIIEFQINSKILDYDTKVNQALDVVKKLEELNKKVDRIIWISPLTLEARTKNNVFLFASARDLDEQFSDLDAVVLNLGIKSGKLYDLRIKNFSVRDL